MSVGMSARDSGNADQVLFGFSPPSASAKTLLDAITMIQEYSIAEEKSPIPETFLTLKGQALLFGIGFKSSFDSVMMSLFLVPLGLFIYLWPGEKTASVYVFAVLLMVIMPLAMSLLLISLAKYPKWNRSLTIFTINRLLMGITTGGIIMSLIVFAALYLLLTKVILEYYPYWQSQLVSLPNLPEHVKLIPLPAAWIILILHIFLPLIPSVFVLWKKRKISKKTAV